MAIDSLLGRFGFGNGSQKFDDKTVNRQDKQLSKKEWLEVKQLLEKLPDGDTRAAFEDWIKKTGVTRSVLEKLHDLAKDRKRSVQSLR